MPSVTTISTVAGPAAILVHDGVNIRVAPVLITAAQKTSTKWTLFAADTLDECQAEITRLNLTPLPPPAPPSPPSS